MCFQVCLVRQGEASSATAAVTKVARHPNCANATFQSRFENKREVFASNSGRIGLVEIMAGIGVWVERIFEAQVGHQPDEVARSRGVLSHAIL